MFPTKRGGEETGTRLKEEITDKYYKLFYRVILSCFSQFDVNDIGNTWRGLMSRRMPRVNLGKQDYIPSVVKNTEKEKVLQATAGKTKRQRAYR